MDTSLTKMTSSSLFCICHQADGFLEDFLSIQLYNSVASRTG